jgi:glycosyltransferase involved in cell wall biosynthesis
MSSDSKKHKKKLKRNKLVKEKKLLEQAATDLKKQQAVSHPKAPKAPTTQIGKLDPRRAQSVINYIADKQGCGYFRCIWPVELLSVYKQMSSQLLTQYVFDANFLAIARSIRFQRASDPIHKQAWDSYLNIKQKHGYHYNLHYEIDDLLMEIESTNAVAYQYFNEQRKENHLHMLRTSDKVVFSTDALKDRYVDKYGIDADKIVVVKNTLPQFMYKFPHKYEPRKFWTPEMVSNEDGQQQEVRGPDNNIIWKKSQDTKGKAILNGYGDVVKESTRKPRIYWSGSSSHLGKGGDLEFIKELVLKTLDEYQWVFHGVVPPELDDHVKSGKIEKIPWSVTYAFPMTQYYKAQPDICLAPIKAGIFNQCKSDLKLLEASALGAPCICSSFEGTEWRSPYEDNAEICIENNAEIWKCAIDHLLNNPDYYMDVVNSQYKMLNGRWMENNLDQWAKAML